MSYNLENSLYRVASTQSIKSKLLVIKDIGHRSGLENLALFTNSYLKEIGLVTSSFSRDLRLYIGDDWSNGSPALFKILIRKIKNEIPYLGDGLNVYLYPHRFSLHMRLVDTPAVRRYVNRYASKLSDLTDDSTFISMSPHSTQNINTVEYSLSIPTLGTGRYASAYKILRYLEHIITAMHTLHRMADIPEQTIEDINARTVITESVDDVASILDDLNNLLART